jgi:transcriptional regulator with XRE-family HTH domain
MINEKVLKEARKKIGEYLSEVRKEKEVSYYRIEKETGLKQQRCKAIENGADNYTIDSLLKLMNILDLYIFFSPREGKHLDIDDMAKKGGEG